MRNNLGASFVLLILLFFASFVPMNSNDNSLIVQTAENFTFIIYGDSRGSSSLEPVSPLHEDLIHSALQHSPDFIIQTGDMVYSGGIWTQWLAFNESLQAIWEAHIPYFAVVGNHEKYTDVYNVFDADFSNFTTFFDYSSIIDEPNETETYFSFDYEGVHFLFLNTEDYFDDNTEIYNCSTSQMSWLLSDLANTAVTDFIVVIYHRPAWSIRQNQPDRWAQAETIRHEFHNLFVLYDVDIVFSGHDHYYYRGIRDGIYYVITAGGGASLYPIDTTAPHWQAGDVAYVAHHYCVVTVSPMSVSVSAVMLDNSSIDSFVIQRIPQGNLIPPGLLWLIIIGLFLIIIILILITFIIKHYQK